MTDDRLNITAVILTKNEERNLTKALESINKNVKKIIVIDSFSNDSTVDIARTFGCEVIQHKSATQSTIYQWFFENYNIVTKWVMRVDADERWTENGFDELRRIISANEVDGVYVNRKTYFMNKPIMHGGYYPIRLLLVWRLGTVSVENRLMDEHFICNGKTTLSNIDVLEQNYDRQSNLYFWTDKHNKYSDRYAAESILMDYGLIERNRLKFDIKNFTTIKSFLRVGFYDKAPLFIRPILYYMFRYFIQGGFLDGKEGFIYHYLQAFWFRFLVDSKIFQMKKEIKNTNLSPIDYLREHHKIILINGKIYFSD